MASELVRELIDAGIHFGHRASRWNPKMAPYIFGKRNTIHIIDIRETVKGLLRAKRFITQMVAKGEDVLYVGTKRQARLIIQQQAERVSMPYVTERWLGGTLTNFRTIRSRLTRLDELEAEVADGTSLEYSKKMISTRARELRKIKRNLEGIRIMENQPGLLVVIDVHRERNALREAKKLGIPTVCLIDTDSDPDFADVPIPGNDDAIRSIGTILSHLTDAVEEGLKARIVPKQPEEPEPKRRSRRPATARANDGKNKNEEKTANDKVQSSTDSQSAESGQADLTPATATESDSPS